MTTKMTHKGWFGGVLPVECDAEGYHVRYPDIAACRWTFEIFMGFAALQSMLTGESVSVKIRWMKENKNA